VSSSTIADEQSDTLQRLSLIVDVDDLGHIEDRQPASGDAVADGWGPQSETTENALNRMPFTTSGFLISTVCGCSIR
jgi:hypothetical protein